MHIHNTDQWSQQHNYIGDSGPAERSTIKVIIITVTMMVIEIIAGMVFGSIALLADGWHMATHVAAFGITVFAYRYARSHASDPRFSFGTGKVSVLGGFASAVALAVVALVMALESLLRMLHPLEIQFNDAITIAVMGLLVNLVSGLILRDRHDHRHEHEDENAHLHHDHNLRAAYLHVLADALTSLFAIVALAAGKFFGWIWLDPLMGLVGAAVIIRWSHGLLRDTSRILLDSIPDQKIHTAIRQA
ncbi:MAG TPA: CDF family Co(II)/Ni(II) efflux transporter DmeF, partial [Candidatus Sumerlaeota bacterium]|nr:CDF family Co(II)/Ni(II) efflux transporter DmeF [Candidatus Sumerlaeota bacterium]